MTDLVELVQRLGTPRVLVLGDVMLDRYVWGNAERISQEAPVILLRADKREERLGGASRAAATRQGLGAKASIAAAMLTPVGAKTSIVGVVGKDGDALQVRNILSQLGIDAEGIIADADR